MESAKIIFEFKNNRSMKKFFKLFRKFLESSHSSEIALPEKNKEEKELVEEREALYKVLKQCLDRKALRSAIQKYMADKEEEENENLNTSEDDEEDAIPCFRKKKN